MAQFCSLSAHHNTYYNLCRRDQSVKSITIISTQRQHTVKVNHVPLSVSKQQLKALFDVHGSCDVHLRHQYGQIEQHAFVNFTSHKAAQAAAKRLNGTVFSGGTITVKLQGCNCHTSLSTSTGTYTVKVENLSKKVTKEILEEVFGFYGDTEVISVKINTPDTSPFNYAYINYSNAQDAQRAVEELNGSKILGSVVRVKIQNSGNLDTRSPTSFPVTVSQYLPTSNRYPITHLPSSVPTAVPQAAPQPVTCQPWHGRFASFPQPLPYYGGYPAFPSPSVIRPGGFSMFPSPPPAFVAPLPAELGVLTRPPRYDSSKPPLSNTIKVTIHGHLTGEDLETIFDQFGTITMKPNIISGTPDFAYVNYESPDQAQVAAMSMHRQRIKGVSVDVKVSKDNRRSSALMAQASSHDYQNIDCEPLIVQVMTSSDLPEFKLQLQGIESSTSIRVMPMKSGNGFNISGNQEKLEEAQSLLKVVISKAQEKIEEEHFTLLCHCVPLFTNQETLKQIAKIEQRHCVEFHVFNSSTQQPVEISILSKSIAIQFVHHTNSPATIGCASRYLCASSSTQMELPEADSADVWEWQDDDGSFKPYERDQCKDFSLRFQQDPTSTFTCSIVTKLGLTEYAINFQTMKQTNVSTGKSRHIQHQSVKGSSAVWYFNDNEERMVPFTKQQSLEIERARMSGTTTLLMNINRKRYKLDLIQMKQTNMHTSRERKITRKPPTSRLLNFRVRGLKESLKQAVLDLKEELQAGVVTTSIPLPSDSEGTFHSSLHELTNNYFVSASICDNTMHIEGVQGYIDKVAIKVREETLSFESKILARRSSTAASTSHSVPWPQPEYWEVQTEEIVLKAVSHGSKEWKDVETLMHATLPSARIQKLERIQNKWLWEKYCFSKERMSQQNNGVINERELFHGTSTTPPEKIYKSRQGFDFRFCSTHTLWGTGTYFAVEARYSDAKYAYHLSGVKQLILAKVLTGEAYQSPTPERDLTKPPVNKKKQLSMGMNLSAFVDELYDSVHGTANGLDIYVIYDHDKAYPDYLITYITNHSYLLS